MCLFAYECALVLSLSLSFTPCFIQNAHTIWYTVNIYYSKYTWQSGWAVYVCVRVHSKCTCVQEWSVRLLYYCYYHCIHSTCTACMLFPLNESIFPVSHPISFSLSIFVYLLCIIIIIIAIMMLVVLLVAWCRAEACDWIIWFSGRIWTTAVLQCH